MNDEKQEIRDSLNEIKDRLDRVEGLLKTPGGPLIHHVNKLRGDIINALSRHDYYNYSQIESFLKLLNHTNDGVNYPPMRGWAISPDLALILYNEVVHNKPNNIIEFGCGVSTVIFAKALRENGKGMLTSIESSKHYAEKTIDTLKSNNLDAWVKVINAEVVDNSLDKFSCDPRMKNFKWYDCEILIEEGVLNILYDFVLIDGPPGSTAEMARYPAIPFLADNLSENALVYLDDARREDETKISQLWVDKFLFNYSFLNLDKGAGFFTKKGNK